MKLLKMFLLSFIPILLLFTAKAFADDSGEVAATVTLQNISLTVSDGTISYGILAANTTKATVDLDPVDTQTVENKGNVPAKFNIKGTDSTNWTLESSTGVQNQYVHKFCIASCATPGNYFALAEESYSTLAASVNPSSSVSLDLAITTPTSSTTFEAQSVNVVVQATLPD
jgi:hypothetical protein